MTALRRELPLEQEVPDHVFRDAHGEVRLSELVDAEHPLILMHFMYGKKQRDFCPMCTLWADGYDGLVPHVTQRARFAVLAAGDATAFSDYGKTRGWRNLRLLSAGDSSPKRDLGFEDGEGGQSPGVSVFAERDGRLLHFYSVSAEILPGEFNGMDAFCPTWQFFDLLPDGRGDFFPKREY